MYHLCSLGSLNKTGWQNCTVGQLVKKVNENVFISLIARHKLVPKPGIYGGIHVHQELKD